MIDSGHVDGTIAYHEALRNEGQLPTKPPHKAQDFHAILAKILELFVEIQNSGFYWDLQINGEVHEDIKFVPYVSHIRPTPPKRIPSVVNSQQKQGTSRCCVVNVCVQREKVTTHLPSTPSKRRRKFGTCKERRD